MIKGILFDFDGTLSNRKQAAYNMYRQCIAQMKPDLDPHGIAFENLVQFCMVTDQYGTVQKDYVWTRLKTKHIPELDVEKWTDYWYANFNAIQIPSENAEETLIRLRKKYKLGILSNGAYESQLAKVKMLGFDRLVDEVIICGQHGIDKPDIRIFNIAAEKLGLPCSEIAMVGDMFFTDIYGAEKAGMKPVWYIGSENYISDYPVARVRTFGELYDLFEGEDSE